MQYADFRAAYQIPSVVHSLRPVLFGTKLLLLMTVYTFMTNEGFGRASLRHRHCVYTKYTWYVLQGALLRGRPTSPATLAQEGKAYIKLLCEADRGP